MEYKNNENYQEQLNDLMSQLRMSLSNYKKSFVQYKVYGTSEQEQIYNNDKNNVRLTLNKLFLLKNKLTREITTLSRDLTRKSRALNSFDTTIDTQEKRLHKLTDAVNATGVRESDYELLLNDEYRNTLFYSLGLITTISLFYYNF